MDKLTSRNDGWEKGTLQETIPATQEMIVAVTAIIGRVAALAGQDTEFQSALVHLIAGLRGTTQTTRDDGDEAEAACPSLECDEQQQAEPGGDARMIYFDPAATLSVVPTPTILRAPREPADLSVIEARCRLKAEGARWAIKRQREIGEGAHFSTAIQPRDRELIERAKKLSCFLWMNHPNGPRPIDMGLFDALADCFQVAADATALLQECTVKNRAKDLARECLEVAAEAQSALLAAVMAVWSHNDTEQQAIYEWLRTMAAEAGIFIERHMRIDDLADPFSAADIGDRIQAVRERCRQSLARQQQRTDWLQRIRYHTNRVASGGATDHDWQTIAQVTDEMVKDGVPPSTREIREIMLPIIDFVPPTDGFPPSFRLVLREIQTYRSAQDKRPARQGDVAPATEVSSSRKLLEGTSLVIIGGESRAHAAQALKEAFALEDVVWLESREHESTERFKPYIKRDNVKAVILLIRWSSHSYGELKRFCDQHGKLFVRLPGGYGPNQVASQIMAQCGEAHCET